MDGDRYKPFSVLGPRQKKRRLLVQRHSNESQNPIESIDSNTSSEESSEINEHDYDEQELLSDNDPETNSSNAEDTNDEDSNEEDGVDVNDIPIENVLEENEPSDNSSSGDELPVVNINPNPGNIIYRRTLKNAFLAAGLKHTQGNIILKALRANPFHLNTLPQDTRTLLQTPTIVVSRLIEDIAGGQYLHIGFKSTLMKKLETLPPDMLPNSIVIDFSTDGGKVNKGMEQFWPHQFRVFNIPDKRPMIAGVFQGKHKPSNPFDFYEKFVREIVEVREEGGILIRNRRLPLIVRCFIADCPARAFVLNHKGHSSSKACSKCKVEGQRSTVPGFGGTMIFPGIRHPLRTDEEYENIVDEDHHKGRSPIAPLLGLVTRVPFESLHSVWLGNVKKIVSAQVEGKFGYQRLNGRKLSIIDARMIILKTYCPSEFNRRPSEITMYNHFKATEFRQLLLYTAPSVLKNVFFEEYYAHFMLLHCVMRLLISEETPRQMHNFCQEALESYVNLCEELYGEQFLSYNVHALLHLVSDVEVLGSLETFSAFCYENNMPEFRKYIRKPHETLQQYYKRICELDDFHAAPFNNDIVLRLSLPHANGVLPEDYPANLCRQYRKIQLGAFTFATKLRDNCCILRNSRICVIRNIIEFEGEILFIVQYFRRTSNVYNNAIPSRNVGVWRCSDLSKRVRAVNLQNVKNKMYRMPQWSDVEGEEEVTVANEWICVSLLTPLILPQN